MLNTYVNPLLSAWVKNVYSLCFDGGYACGSLYTDMRTTSLRAINMGVKPQSYTQLTTSFTPYIFTAIFSNLYLLMNHLYTVSTGPIIKTKGLKRKEIQ